MKEAKRGSPVSGRDNEQRQKARKNRKKAEKLIRPVTTTIKHGRITAEL